MKIAHPYCYALSLATLLCFSAATLRAQYYDITRFGAKGDGVTDNTAAIQQAIDSCAITGGKVYFPAGKFLTATLQLRSNITVHVSAGATVLANTDISKYPHLDAGIPFYGELWARQAVFFGKQLDNITLEGSGTLDGQGASFVITTDKKPERYMNRPYLLWFAGCTNVTVKDLQLRNSAFWMQHYLGCSFVNISGLRIWNHSNKNNDMMDIDGCRYVTISNIIGDSDDDGITIKSTSPLVSEYITVTNCVLSSHCNALKFGTESTGGFRNITVSNCIIKPSGQTSTIYGKPAGISGVALEMVDGGIMENVAINNLVIEGTEVPLFIRLGNRARKYRESAAQPGKGVLRNVHLSNILATGSAGIGCALVGLPGSPIEEISLSNISIQSAGGGKAADMGKIIEEKEKDYPEATMFGVLPAYGFYVRHATGLRLNDIRLRYKENEDRPAIVLSDVKGFSVSGLEAQTGSNTPAAVYAEQSSNGVLFQSVQSSGTPLLKTGKGAVNISVTGNSMKSGKK
ncbi:MAG: glycosyl hydrolase family 28-related protein [Candidatus Pseudobacter hemicellulosilyticus]|uniref:Glycosyl hydrolase family 28-related protein n=1 Tax=Candidatus Pseudobacter hemicellulosilyticus TaxID=3121375 RepID=A0AAJ6BFX4_9BACT|nr:MAG: glycosyl hydrolase family 28-related protein [Pseudobacter sp.]